MINDSFPSNVPMGKSELHDAAADRSTAYELQPAELPEDVVDSDAEILGQLKAEFEEFVERTLERLHSVSEALDALNCEYFPESTRSQTYKQNTQSRRMSSNSSETRSWDAGEHSVMGEEDEHRCEDNSSDASPPVEASSRASQRCDENQLDGESVSPMDAIPTSNEIPGKTAVTDHDGAAVPAGETQRLGAAAAGVDDSELAERLNAIKDRLARQIENA